MNTNNTFEKFSLTPELIDSLTSQGFNTPSPIQNMAIPAILEGMDILALAETGSGKTGSFAIPILEMLMRHKQEHGDFGPTISYLVLSPTRELAQQTHKVFELFGKKLNVKAVSIIGGESIQRQKELIDDNPQILVATPGRMKDLLGQKLVETHALKAIVFDEADRLFDMGFQKDIEYILNTAPKNRQLLMVSATSNFEVLNMAYRFHSEPLEIKLNEDKILVENIDHKLAIIDGKEKMPLLVGLLRKNPDAYAIIFCNTKVQTHQLAEWLRMMDFKAEAISGGLAQNKRTKLMEDFRNKKVTILVCTDVAARGLDIKDVNLVINYDLPLEAANYVHRIGRTGRAGKNGFAISFCAYEDCSQLDPINHVINGTIPKMTINNDDFATDIPRAPRVDRNTLKVVQPYNKNSAPTNNNRNDSRRGQDNTRDRKPAPVREERMRRSYRPPQDFEYQGYSLQEGQALAMAKFKVKSPQFIGHKIITEGRKKYFIFGPKLATYKFYFRPNYKNFLLPFLIEIIKKSSLQLFVNVFGRDNNQTISFKGKDTNLLVQNNNALLNAFEQIVDVYLSAKLDQNLVPNMRLQIEEAVSEKDQEKKLISLIEKSKKQLGGTNKSISLGMLNPQERRIVHQYLQEDNQFKSTSVGDGRIKQMRIELR